MQLVNVEAGALGKGLPRRRAAHPSELVRGPSSPKMPDGDVLAQQVEVIGRVAETADHQPRGVDFAPDVPQPLVVTLENCANGRASG